MAPARKTHASPLWRGLAARAIALVAALLLLQLLLLQNGRQPTAEQPGGRQQRHVYRWRLAGRTVALEVGTAADDALEARDSGDGCVKGTLPSGGAGGGVSVEGRRAQQQQQQQQQQEKQQQQQQQEDLSTGVAELDPSAVSLLTGRSAGGAGSGGAGGGPLACEGSDLCSVGKVKRYHGDIATNEQLRRLVEAVAYKKEIIMVTTGFPGSAFPVNIVRDAWALGLAHIFLLTGSAAQCGQLPAPYRGGVSCVWDPRHSLESAGAAADLMQKRWEVTARALRMGYNVLSLDDDVALLDDPYRYLKSPVFSQYNALFHREGNHLGGVNCGVMYWQNCHPSGPAVHMVVELADRTLRQREDPGAMKRVYTDLWDMLATWDQPTFDDMVLSAFLGRPLILTPSGDLMEEAWFMENQLSADGFRNATTEVVQWPEAWQQRTLYPSDRLTSVQELRFPVPTNASWWEAHAAHFYPPHRRNSSAAFIELMHSASTEPLYQIGGSEKAPQGLAPEKWAYLPAWFAGTWGNRGALGFWAQEPPAAVIAHAAYSYGPKGSGLWKSYVMRGHGWWHWEVSEALHGGNLLGLPGEPKLLMLAPGVALYTDTEEAFRAAVVKFARLAEALGRRFVVPNPPCDSVWLGVFSNERLEKSGFQPGSPADADVHVWPDLYDGMMVLQFPDWPRRRRGHKGASYCHWIRGLTHDCVAAVPTHVDVTAYLERALPPEQAAPSEGNTVWFAEWQAAGGLDGPLTRQQQGQLKEERQHTAPAVELPSAAAAIEAGGKHQDAPVLFLGAVPLWGDEEAALPPIPDAYRSCYLFQPKWRLDIESGPSTSQGQANRQARLNGTAAAAPKPAARLRRAH